MPALDGLRGLALLGVMLFHANGALAGGYLGVDLFFVLSGFLITSLLVAEYRATGAVALASFWTRRAKRLLPALLLMTAVVVCGGRYAVATDEGARALRADALATLAYVANWHAIAKGVSYWDLFAAPSLFEHTWSLAIEEQFYIVWPLIVVFVLRRGGTRALLGVTIALAISSVTAMTLLAEPGHTARAYLGTDTRAAALLAGAALATVRGTEPSPHQGAVVLSDVLGAVGALGLGAAWWSLDGQDTFVYRGGLWLTEIAVLVLVWCATVGPSRSRVARVLSFRPLVWLGTISYGAYLWHWPIDVMLTTERAHVTGVALHALRMAITLAVAALSHRLLEAPVRNSPRPLRWGLAGATIMTVAAVIVFLRTSSSPRAASEREPNAASRARAETPPDEPVRFRVMVVGDSTANSLGWALRGLREKGVGVELRGQDGCAMVADLCGGETWSTMTNELRPDVSLVVLGGAFMHGLGIDGRWRKACYPGWDARFEAMLLRRLDSLRAPGTRVFVTTVPLPLGVWETKAFHHEVSCINASIRRVVSNVADVELLDIAGYLCPDGECHRERAGITIRPDGVHYAIDGASSVASWTLASIRPSEAQAAARPDGIR